MITPKFWHRGKRDEKAVDSCYGTNSEVTDMEISCFFLSHVIAHPPSDLQLSPPPVPAKQMNLMGKEQPKHFHPSPMVSKPVSTRGFTSSHGSHTSHTLR